MRSTIAVWVISLILELYVVAIFYGQALLLKDLLFLNHVSFVILRIATDGFI